MIAILPILAAALLAATDRSLSVCPSTSRPAAAERVARPTQPADTSRSTRSPRGERVPAARKRKQTNPRGTIAAPGAGRRPMDDQVWNSEFYVRNARPAIPHPSVRLASARIR